MASPNFPSTGLVPNVTTFTVGNIIYKWDGEKWKTITADLSADQIKWTDSKTAGYGLDDLQGFTEALLDDAGITDSGIADTAVASQRLDAIKIVSVKETLDKLTDKVPLNEGVWASGQEFTVYNQYMIYNGEAYSPLPATALPYTAGATPDLGFVYQIKLNDHSALSHLNPGDGSAHNADDIKDTKNGGSVQDFIDGFTEALQTNDVAYVDTYPGANAGEKIAQALADLPASGGVLDARRLTGTQFFASDVFAGVGTPFVLLTGVATYEMDMTVNNLSLGSHQKVIMFGTTFRPNRVNTDAAKSSGLFSTKVNKTSGSIASGSNILTVSDASLIEVGCLVAVDGAEGVSTNEQQPIVGNITDTDTSITLADASNVPSTYTLWIGSELIVGSGKTGNTLNNVTRGAYGTTAAAHLNGAVASLSPYFRALVKEVNGNVLTLSGTAVEDVTGARVLSGSVDVAVAGNGLIDGRLDRSTPINNTNIYGVSLNMATFSIVDKGVKLFNWDHGGVYLESAWYNQVYGEYRGNSRPADQLGANIWIFRRSSFNLVQPSVVSDSFIGVFCDDRTSSANLLDGASNKNTIRLPALDAVSTGVDISGSNDNSITSPYIAAKVPVSMSTNDQGTTPRSCTGNTASIGHAEGVIASASVRGVNNYVSIGFADVAPSLTGSTLRAGQSSFATIHAGAAAGEYHGSDISSPLKTYVSYAEASTRLKSLQDGLVYNSPIGKWEVYGSEQSGPGPGIKGAIKVQSGSSNGSLSHMKFSLNIGGVNDHDTLIIDGTGSFTPLDDNVRNLGSAPLRWGTVFAGTGTINTSDRREKTTPEIVTDEIIDAWGDVRLISYKWLEAVTKKGEAARTHFGLIAQEIDEAFKIKGIDATKFGLLCYDEWHDVFGESGEIELKAGNRWGIRHDQCLFLEAMYQRRRCDRIEKRLEELESKL